MIRILKAIYRLIRKIFFWPNRFKRRFFNYWLPNCKNILLKRIALDSNVRFDQHTRFEGAGVVEIGENCSFGFKLGGFHKNGSIEIQARYKESRIRIGMNVNTNNNIFICAANYIEIGSNALIGQNVTIMDHEAHGIEPDKRRGLGEIGQVIIHDNVWVGNNVTILKNSEIGKNSVVATGAVVAGKFPANVILGGVPAKVIKSL